VTTKTNAKLHNLELTDREVKTIGEKRWLYKHRTSVMLWLLIPVVCYFILSFISYQTKVALPIWAFYVLAVIFLIGVVRYIFGSEAAGKAFLKYIDEQEGDNATDYGKTESKTA
jgi:membrane protein YdbS with pleckstrin-like domain